MSQGNLSELETMSHGSSFTPQLAAACRVNVHWLATGEGDMLDVESHGVKEPKSAAYRVKSAAGVTDMVQLLSEVLTSHGAARRRTLADVLARFAVDPNNAELADELAAQLEPASKAHASKRSVA